MVSFDVITYCSGYSYEIFDRFVGTLNDTGFKGKIHIIINEFDMPIIKLLKKKYNNVYPLKDSIPKKTHINCHRFFCIRSLLKNFSISSDYLLLCDSRDVLFQKNLENYSYDLNVDIYGFLEEITIENEQVYNARWIKALDNLLHINIYEQVHKNNVICCGTTIGKKDAIIKYVNMMCDIITSNNIITNLDQGIHNYMLYLNPLNLNIKLLSNRDNLVNTTGNGERYLNDSNQVLNELGDLSYIVHQYDRFPMEMREKMSNEKYNFAL